MCVDFAVTLWICNNQVNAICVPQRRTPLQVHAFVPRTTRRLRIYLTGTKDETVRFYPLFWIDTLCHISSYVREMPGSRNKSERRRFASAIAHSGTGTFCKSSPRLSQRSSTSCILSAAGSDSSGAGSIVMADPRMSDSVKKRTRKPAFYRQSPLPPDGIQAIFCDSCITTWLTRWPFIGHSD